MQEHGGHKAPPLVFGPNEIVQLRAKGNQYGFRQGSQEAKRHSARLPHQREDENIGDQQNDGELVGPIKDRAGKSHRLAIGNHSRLARGSASGNRCPANCALLLATAHDRAATATHSWATGIGSPIFFPGRLIKQEALHQQA